MKVSTFIGILSVASCAFVFIVHVEEPRVAVGWLVATIWALSYLIETLNHKE